MSLHYERIVSSMLSELKPGSPVITADGEELGTLAEVRGEFIKVNATMRPDYWIKADFVLGSDGERVNVAFNHTELDAYKVDQPADQDDPMKEQEADSSISAEEQIRQRMRMEAELAEQRRQLGHAQGKDAQPDTLGEPVESELARLEREYGPVPASLPRYGEVSGDDHPAHSFASGRAPWLLAGALVLGIAGAFWLRSRRRVNRSELPA